MAWKCFMLVPSDRARRSLRRYSHKSSTNERHPYHNAQVQIEDAELIRSADGSYVAASDSELAQFQADPRWGQVARCECGYVFEDDDPRQVFREAIYVRAPDETTVELVAAPNGHYSQEHFTLRSAPVGAMWDTPWWLPDYAGPDGRCITVQTPGGDWTIDGPSSGTHGKLGPPWQRTGIPPRITVSPSIQIDGRYHGFLLDGVLTSDIEGRTYPEHPDTA